MGKGRGLLQTNRKSRLLGIPDQSSSPAVHVRARGGDPAVFALPKKDAATPGPVTRNS